MVAMVILSLSVLKVRSLFTRKEMLEGCKSLAEQFETFLQETHDPQREVAMYSRYQEERTVPYNNSGQRLVDIVEKIFGGRPAPRYLDAADYQLIGSDRTDSCWHTILDKYDAAIRSWIRNPEQQSSISFYQLVSAAVEEEYGRAESQEVSATQDDHTGESATEDASTVTSPAENILISEPTVQPERIEATLEEPTATASHFETQGDTQNQERQAQEPAASSENASKGEANPQTVSLGNLFIQKVVTLKEKADLLRQLLLAYTPKFVSKVSLPARKLGAKLLECEKCQSALRAISPVTSRLSLAKRMFRISVRPIVVAFLSEQVVSRVSTNSIYLGVIAALAVIFLFRRVFLR